MTFSVSRIGTLFCPMGPLFEILDRSPQVCLCTSSASGLRLMDVDRM